MHYLVCTFHPQSDWRWLNWPKRRLTTSNIVTAGKPTCTSPLHCSKKPVVVSGGRKLPSALHSVRRAKKSTVTISNVIRNSSSGSCSTSHLSQALPPHRLLLVATLRRRHLRRPFLDGKDSAVATRSVSPATVTSGARLVTTFVARHVHFTQLIPITKGETSRASLGSAAISYPKIYRL
jgi:hypothetical protein